jgi:hypothetical protein
MFSSNHCFNALTLWKILNISLYSFNKIDPLMRNYRVGSETTKKVNFKIIFCVINWFIIRLIIMICFFLLEFLKKLDLVCLQFPLRN